MFKRRALQAKQIKGLYDISAGMEVQIEHIGSRATWLRNAERIQEAQETDAIVRTIRYWKNEVDKAIRGEL